MSGQSGRKRAPLLVRVTVVADLVGVTGSTVRRLCREGNVPCWQMHGKGPWYLDPAGAARVAWLALGRQADKSYRDAIRRRAKTQRDAFGAFRTEPTAVGPGGTGLEIPTSTNTPTPSPGPATTPSFVTQDSKGTN